MDADFITIINHLAHLEKHFRERLQSIETNVMTTAQDLQAAVQASNNAIADLNVSVDKLIGLASFTAAALTSALAASAASGAAVPDSVISQAIESLKAGAAAAVAEGVKVVAAIKEDSVAPAVPPAPAPQVALASEAPAA